MIMDICLCLYSSRLNAEMSKKVCRVNTVYLSVLLSLLSTKMKKALCFLCGRNLANGYIKQTKLEGKVLLLHPGPYGFLWLLFLLYWILFLLLFKGCLI